MTYGKYEKFLMEKKKLQASRRSIYAKKVILKINTIESDISIIRPGRGYEPKQLRFLLNKKTKKL